MPHSVHQHGRLVGMARVEVFADRVVIKLTTTERALALRRRDVVLTRDAITSALITDDPWVWLRGVRSPGTYLPTKLAMGTWRGLGGKDFALIRSGRPAVVLDFDTSSSETSAGDEFERVILSTEHSADLISALRLEGESAGAVFHTGQ